MNALPCDPAELAQTLFEETADALFLFDPTSAQIVEVNSAAARLIGSPRAQLLHQPLGEFIRPETPGVEVSLRDALPACDGFLLRQHDDIWLPVRLTITPLPSRPRPLNLLRALDLREKRAAQQQLLQTEDELRRVLASVPDCVWSAELDESGAWHMRYCSPVIETITGRLASPFIGVLDPWLEIVHPEDRSYYRQQVELLVERAEPCTLEYRIVMPDNAIRWVRDALQPRRLENGVLRIDAVFSDINERRRVEEELQANQKLIEEKWVQLRGLFQGIPVGLALYDAQCRYVLVNEYLAGINGKPVEGHIGQTPLDVLPADLARITLERLHMVMRTGQAIPQAEVHAAAPSRPGKVRFWRVSYHPNLLADGTVNGVYLTVVDITQLKETQAALLESQHRFEAFMNTIPLVGFMKNADGRMVYVNQEFAKRFQKPAAYFQDKFDTDLWPAEIVHALQDTDRRVMAGTDPVELRELVPTPDGVVREWWVVKFPFRDSEGRVFLGGIALDLTERRQLEEALRRSEARYRQLWQRNLAGVFRATIDGRILNCNDSFAHLFGYGSREEMLARSTKDLYFDLGAREEFLARLRENLYLTNNEMCLRRADGAPVWVLENINLLFEDGEEILEGTIVDISERKRIEEALRGSEANYRTLINHLDQAIFLKDHELRYVTVNPVFCKAMGIREEVLRGRTISDLFPGADTEKARSIEARVLEHGRPIETEDVFTIEGQVRTVRVSRTPVKDGQGAVVGVLGICWDVTEQRELETQLRHVDKMDAIGQLAGGIAHDFNNLLTIMLGNLSYVLSQSLDGPASLELIRNAELAGLRAAELTQTLLGFSRRAALTTVPFSLNQAIDEVVRLTRATLPAHIEVKIDARADLWLVQADPGQMNQVLTNLTLNARDVLPHGGKITYQTSHFIPDAEYLSSHVEAQPGEYVRLSVRDDGPGIPVELRQRIFEPFFTTKEKGKGTGLGLAIVFSIVKQHNGWIVCESQPNCGTSFDIFLPRCQVVPPVPAPAPEPALPTPGEIILLVDDEHMIRQLTKTILTRAGYQVLLAENGAVALDIVDAQHHQIALIILDAIMPRLSGRDTLRELARRAPEIPVLFSSGYSTEQMAVHEFPQVHGFLPKPYRAEQLIQKVTEILGAARRTSEKSR